MTKPLVTCVVVAFHRPGPLQRLLGQLDDPRLDVVVVNVEDDADVAAVAGARAVPLRGNPGYAAAVNHGVAAARGDVVVFTNDDVEATASDVLALAAVVASGRADVCVPRVTDALGRVERTVAPLVSPGALAREWALLPDRPVGALRRGVQKWRLPLVPEPIDAAAAVMVATRTDLLRRMPLPEAYFLYWEESEWFWHLHRAGARVLYDPTVSVRHTGGRGDVRAEKSRLLATNAVRCIRRTQGRTRAALAWPVVVLWNVRLVTLDTMRSLSRWAQGRDRVVARVAGLRAALAAWREI